MNLASWFPPGRRRTKKPRPDIGRGLTIAILREEVMEKWPDLYLL